MKMVESPLARRYEELANHFARQGESRQRDHCLVLAADAALTDGQAEEAERLRKRLLLTNPNHLVRPYSSMAEAMQSDDVRAFVVDLRKQWPPEMIEKLLNRNTPSAPATPYGIEMPMAPAVDVKRPKPMSSPPVAPPAPISGAGYWLAIMLFAVGLAVAGGFLFAALGWPLVE